MSTEHQRLVDAIINSACHEPVANAAPPLNPTDGGASSSGEVGEDDVSGVKRKLSEEQTGTTSIKKQRVHRTLPVVADMMGGVGPFGVPLAKSGRVKVFCNGQLLCVYSHCVMCISGSITMIDMSPDRGNGRSQSRVV